MFRQQQNKNEKYQFLAIGLVIGVAGAYYYFQQKECPTGYTKDVATGGCLKTITSGSGGTTTGGGTTTNNNNGGCGCGCSGGVTILTNGLAGIRTRRT